MNINLEDSKKINRLRIALILVLILVISPSLAIAQQRVGVNQFQNDIQLLSEEQLNTFWTNAKRRGYTIRTVPVLLQESGYSYNEALNIVEQIKVLEQSTIGFSNSSLSAFEQKIFGLSIFRDRNFEFTNFNYLPTPENYQLGVGDQLSVVIYGEANANYNLSINKEGNVSLPFIGPFSLKGLSIEAARSLIKQKLIRGAHAGLAGPNPNVFMDMTLTNTRSITISILGEVSEPGSYSIPSTSTLFNALYRAGGPSTKGTLRKIKVYRANKLLAEVDLYKFISQGITENSISFEDQDVIVLDTYKKRVELTGGVRNPGIYELNGEESIKDLLRIAGGFEPGADSTSVVLRRLNGPDQFIQSVSVDYLSKDLKDSDVINVELIQDYSIDRVEVTGAVNRPGFYSYSPNMTLENLLTAAGGLRNDAFKSRISIFQLENDLKPLLKAFNLLKEDPSSYSINQRSTVFVPSELEVVEPGYISIEGSVVRSGQLPYFEGMSVLDAIILADGVNDSAIEGNIEVVRTKSLTVNMGYDYFLINIPLNINEIDDFKLQSRDRIFVRDNWLSQEEKTITVQGEVKKPGKFVINPGLTRISDVIERTGSFLKTANLDGLKLYRLVKTVKEENDSSTFLRRKSIANFINDPRFEGSVSTLQYDAANSAFNKLKNDRTIALKNTNKGDFELIESDSIGILNNFKLAKNFVINNESTELLEIGLSYQEILVNPNSQYNVTLLDGDILFIPPQSALVEIDGNVFRPTQAIYRNDKSFKDYVETAGGFKRRSDRKRSYIEYSNGEIKRVRSFLFLHFYPQVETDSRIIIPEKPPGATINYDRIISLITTTISTYLLIEAVSNR